MYIQCKKVDMLLVFEDCHINLWSATQLYTRKYPDLQDLTHQYFPFQDNRFRKEGNREVEWRFVKNIETEINFLAMIVVNKSKPEPVPEVRNIQNLFPSYTCKPISFRYSF